MIGSAEEFVRLRTSEDSADYRRAADEEAPSDVWLAIVRDHPEMRFWVAQNKTVPLAILELLASDADSRVRGMVARKKKTTPDILRRLAADSDDGVRAAVAQHPTTPKEVLQLLVRDEWSGISDVAKRRLEE